MKFTYQVLPDEGEPFVVVARTRDIVTWEKAKAGRSVAQLIGDGVQMSELYALCHIAAKRKGQFDGTAQEFADSVDLETVDDELVDVEPTDPT